MSPWPFAQWGLDLIGKLPTAPGQYKYAIVAVDYYTKWVEVEPLSRITIESVNNFLLKNVYCRFGIPETIITDNGTQFNNPKLIEFTEDMGTRMVFASIAHPTTNEQVEAVNKIIKKLLKKKLDDAKGLWAQRLSEALWAIRTTATESTGETSFSLAFGTKAVIPVELIVPSGRVEGYSEETNAEGLQLNMDLIKEKRERADLHTQVYKQRVARHYDSKVRPRSLGLGDEASDDPTNGP
uniref:protein NYNRIN-like n=1 Tax=Fragaria vesca subsp. vesca TaxID=101020 RepID=UPI0005CB4453|nr:PREDICTED: protein NYNRIN-like [Fragaria vesca subsp. vesca]